MDRPADTFARLLAGAAEEEPGILSGAAGAGAAAVPSGPLGIPDRTRRTIWHKDHAQRQLQSAAPATFGRTEGKLTRGEPSGAGPDAWTGPWSVMAAAFELLECGVWQPVIGEVWYMRGLYPGGTTPF